MRQETELIKSLKTHLMTSPFKSMTQPRFIEQCDIHEFIAAVEQMRSLQKQYFKSKSIDILHQSKAAEVAVDKAIQEFTSHKQTSLF